MTWIQTLPTSPQHSGETRRAISLTDTTSSDRGSEDRHFSPIPDGFSPRHLYGHVYSTVRFSDLLTLQSYGFIGLGPLGRRKDGFDCVLPPVKGEVAR